MEMRILEVLDLEAVDNIIDVQLEGAVSLLQKFYSKT